MSGWWPPLTNRKGDEDDDCDDGDDYGDGGNDEDYDVDYVVWMSGGWSNHYATSSTHCWVPTPRNKKI